jgi:hypothetical protein
MGNHEEMARLYDWPPGVAGACDRIEAGYPGWTVNWVTTSGRFWGRRYDGTEVWADTAFALEGAIAARRS